MRHNAYDKNPRPLMKRTLYALINRSFHYLQLWLSRPKSCCIKRLKFDVLSLLVSGDNSALSRLLRQSHLRLRCAWACILVLYSAGTVRVFIVEAERRSASSCSHSAGLLPARCAAYAFVMF